MKLPALLRISPSATPYVLLSPFVVLFLVFGMFPLGFSLYLAFQTWEPTAGLGAMQYVGLDNFIFSLQDEWFWKSLKNTGWLAVASGVPQRLVAIPLAVFIHNSFKRLRNGVVGRAFGFDVMVSNNCVNSAGDDWIVQAGYPGAISFAEPRIQNLLILAIFWGVAMPLLIYASDRIHTRATVAAGYRGIKTARLD